MGLFNKYEHDRLDWEQAEKYQAYKTFLINYSNRIETLEWLRKNPPPATWKGTPNQWAYTEMPIGIFSYKPGRYL
jgi:hypothetical protein